MAKVRLRAIRIESTDLEDFGHLLAVISLQLHDGVGLDGACVAAIRTREPRTSDVVV